MEPQAPQDPQNNPTPEQPAMAPAPETMAPTPAPEQPMAQPMQSPAPQMASPAPVAGTNPGHGMGIAGLVLAFIAPLIGLILSIIGLNKSKKAGMTNGLAVAGIIISILGLIASVAVILMLTLGTLGAVQEFAEICEQEGPGTHTIDGVTYTCS